MDGVQPPNQQIQDLQAEARKVAQKVLREMNGSASSSTLTTASPTPSQTPGTATPEFPPRSRERTFDMDGSADTYLGSGSKFPGRKKSAIDTSKPVIHQEDELSPKSLPVQLKRGGKGKGKEKSKEKEENEPLFLDTEERSNSVIRIDGMGGNGKKGA